MPYKHFLRSLSSLKSTITSLILSLITAGIPGFDLHMFALLILSALYLHQLSFIRGQLKRTAPTGFLSWETVVPEHFFIAKPNQNYNLLKTFSFKRPFHLNAYHLIV